MTGSASSAGVVGVVGARGGAGASTLAAALAHRLHAGADRAGSRGRGTRRRDGTATAAGSGEPGGVVLVDLDPTGGGLDVQLGVEAVGGLRWPDLAGARGEVSGSELASLLPTWHGMAVLSCDRWRPGPAPPDVVADVLDALAASHRTVVLDLDRRDVLDGGPGPGRCTTVLVVTRRDLGSVAGAVMLRDPLQSAVGDVRLVVTGPAPGGLGVLEVAHVVDLPVAGVLPRDRGVPALVERGAGPVAARRGRFGRAVARLAGDLP